MEIGLKRILTDVDVAKLADAALRPNGQEKLSQLVRVATFTGRRDPLTELQQRILTAAIFLLHPVLKDRAPQTSYTMKNAEFLKLCDAGQGNIFDYLAHELEKLSRKGLWLYDATKRNLIRTLWFQNIELSACEITFQFTTKIIAVIGAIAPEAIEACLLKGI